MSAARGTRIPSRLNAARISGRAAASREVGTVTRTISQPARARRRICSAVAVTSAVSGVVIDWTRIGLLPPIPTSPTRTSRVGRLLQPKGSGFIATAGILHSAGEPGNNAVPVVGVGGLSAKRPRRRLTDLAGYD